MELIKLEKAIILDDRGKKSEVLEFILSKGESIAIVSKNKNLSENVFLAVIGMLPLYAGHITNQCNISWPLGSTEIFDVQLTFVENLHFILNIYPQVVSEEEIRLRINRYIGETRIDYSKSMNAYNIRVRRIFSNALCFALDFEVYAQMKPIILPNKDIDDSKNIKNKELTDIYRNNSFIFCNPEEDLIQEYCTHVYNLDERTKLKVNP